MVNYNDEWQKHLENLDEHYAPENFFIDEKIPTNNPILASQLFDENPWTEEEIMENGELNVDILQDNDNLYIIAPLSGIDPDKIDVYIEKDILTIKGERKKLNILEEKNFLLKECFWGNFSRSLVLPVPILADKIQAEFKNGILKVTLPKSEEGRKFEIKVKNEDNY